jgi:hypothetical protein
VSDQTPFLICDGKHVEYLIEMGINDIDMVRTQDLYSDTMLNYHALTFGMSSDLTIIRQDKVHKNGLSCLNLKCKRELFLPWPEKPVLSPQALLQELSSEQLPGIPGLRTTPTTI